VSHPVPELFGNRFAYYTGSNDADWNADVGVGGISLGKLRVVRIGSRAGHAKLSI
jgi:hypothetical protein